MYNNNAGPWVWVAYALIRVWVWVESSEKRCTFVAFCTRDLLYSPDTYATYGQASVHNLHAYVTCISPIMIKVLKLLQWPWLLESTCIILVALNFYQKISLQILNFTSKIVAFNFLSTILWLARKVSAAKRTIHDSWNSYDFSVFQFEKSKLILSAPTDAG